MNVSNSPSAYDEDEKPLDPATERVRKKMVRLMVVSIGIMMIGLMAVFGAIVYKFTGLGGKNSTQQQVADSGPSPQEGADYRSEIELPEGASIVSTALDGGRVLLTLQLPDGKRELRLYEIRSGRRFATISIR